MNGIYTKDQVEDHEAAEDARVAGLTDKQKAREVFDNFVNAKGVVKATYARIAVDNFAEYLSEKQLAWAAKYAK